VVILYQIVSEQVMLELIAAIKSTFVDKKYMVFRMKHANHEKLKVFGRLLRQEREAAGLTRDDLLERMGILARERYGREISEDSTKLARWERGEQRPTSFHLQLVSEALGTTPAALGLSLPRRGRLAPARSSRSPVRGQGG
jgi:transcriptional regulator with XRE-family HTH domain